MDDFTNLDLDSIKVECLKQPFKLNQLKLTHYHWNYDDYYKGMPITTSIELKSDYNYEKENLEWEKIVCHKYIILSENDEYGINTYTEKLLNETIIKQLEQYDLRNYNNNYFTEENENSFTFWEIEYNNYFKIVGTYDQMIDVLDNISNILNFKEIVKIETEKVKTQIRET